MIHEIAVCLKFTGMDGGRRLAGWPPTRITQELRGRAPSHTKHTLVTHHSTGCNGWVGGLGRRLVEGLFITVR